MSAFLCPYCKDFGDHRITDSRDHREGYVRRRRHCPKCDRRYTTYEHALDIISQVTKRDGRVEPFDRGKLRASIAKAGVEHELVARLVEDVIDAVQDVNILPTSQIADLVADAMRRAAPLAYLRWISAQLHFTDVRQFLAEARRMPLAKARAR